MITLTIGKRAVCALVGAMWLLAGTGCSIVQGNYFPLNKGAASREKPADVTDLTANELEAQGYELIGYITRLWNVKQNKPFWDFRANADGLPSTDPFHASFLSELRAQAGKAGGDLLRREDDRFYQNDVPVLIVSEEGSHWTEAERTLEYKRLTWSVWRRKEAPSNPDGGKDA
ncbi:MAG: hypothetical protein H6970_11410 [Gammaproteobacteria bacterium]|nr:hypothetical protein [Gammaproteobacteria bacterium]MCP5425656.1 hypothetical protein [Gammaproteobacteria bacterium]